ncbi:MAG: iron ABC transporter permease [Muribaculaceae bacterium]|nr:iron ABC transporter permease [Muribaculaceae bacterium]
MNKIRFLILISVTLLLFVSNIIFGAIDIPLSDILTVLTGGENSNRSVEFIILGSRLPQAITALLAGSSLAVAGLLLQTAFRNPLAGPTILGVSSGASLGVALVMLLFGGSMTFGSSVFGGYMAIVVGALAGSFLVMGLLIALSTIIKNDLMLLITGIMVGYLTSSVVTLLSSLSDAQGVRSFVMWGMGTFGDVSLDQLPFFSVACLIGLFLSLVLSKPLNLLLLGENYALNLGVNVKMVRNLLLISTGLLTAVVTAFCGPIGFIGISVPHIARLFLKTDDHLKLIPATMLTGGILALLCNVVSVLPEDMILPINALTPIAGVPVILYVIMKRKG